ncbi:unknown protein [Microcystis aeruginosa NIES-843]|uniref:Uncharacterized protein n=1 Tax=Microcystis aeruginosa (strain NIES-843 / IAM M-2473) TaxID=449447 RepID=B0JU73_MICAN|nr:unknown protein [Microcystis aeruginosa NIES-843]
MESKLVYAKVNEFFLSIRGDGETTSCALRGEMGAGRKKLTANECYDCYNILTLILIP